MGCDIHLIAEVQHHYGSGKDARSYWRRVAPPFNARCPDCVEWAQEHPFDAERAVRAVLCWYCDRNYDTFAILANVRNGYGFAGYPTGAGFIPISEPRGYPADLSDEAQHWAHQYDGKQTGSCLERGPGDHSESWLTLAELKAYDWNRMTTKMGVIPLEEFASREAASRVGERPDSWSGWVSGQGISVIDEAEARQRIHAAGIATLPSEKLYVQVSWPRSYRDAADDFPTRVIPGLASVGAPPEDVRIVFSFDS